MVENLNLEEMQDNDKPKEAFEQLEELQKAGFGQDVTPFYRNKMQPALLNLAPEYQEFFTPGNTTYQKMLLGLLPIGYKNGVEPIVNGMKNHITKLTDECSKLKEKVELEDK